MDDGIRGIAIEIQVRRLLRLDHLDGRMADSVAKVVVQARGDGELRVERRAGDGIPEHQHRIDLIGVPVEVDAPRRLPGLTHRDVDRASRHPQLRMGTEPRDAVR